MSVPFILPLVQANDVALLAARRSIWRRRGGRNSGAGWICHYEEAFRRASGGDGRGAIEEAVRAAYRRMSERGDVAVAVRSSATAEDMAGASMAGQYETYLDIVGEEAVIEAVKKCWASLSTPRTQAYLREHQIDPAAVAMAVVVQELVPAEVAG